jgi:hypothetical protein
MSALDAKLPDEIRASVMSGVVLAISSGANVEYIRGVLALAQHQVLGLGLSWAEFARDAKRELGVDGLGLLDAGCAVIEKCRQ